MVDIVFMPNIQHLFASNSQRKKCAKCNEIPLLSVGEVVPDGIVSLLQQSIVTSPGTTFQQLHHLEPVSQLDPKVNGKVTAETQSIISKDGNQT